MTIRLNEKYVSATGHLTQAGYDVFVAMERRLTTLETLTPRVAAVEADLVVAGAVADPAGGATVDAEARAAIIAITAALS